uniref:TNFAIP3 interacting protein 2 n=1 Tax=Cyanistes caeruleus TaxID=156563 RepID=A0A8C0VR80_CYACU
ASRDPQFWRSSAAEVSGTSICYFLRVCKKQLVCLQSQGWCLSGAWNYRWFAPVTKQNPSFPKHLWRLQKLNQQLEEKNGEIQQMINQPPYEKEREILRLQKTLAEREKAQATSDVLCRSLTDETHQLQRKLASTAEMCQHLAKCLEEKQRKEKENSDDQTPTERSNQLSDNETSLQALICNLQEENRMLKQKVAHVLVYKDDFTSERSDRERAQSKIQELQAEVSCLQHQLARRQDSGLKFHAGNQNHLYVQTNVEHLRGNSPGQTGTRRTNSQSEQASPPRDNTNLGSEGRAQGELRCPHCMRLFSDELGDEFLKHVAECCQ